MKPKKRSKGPVQGSLFKVLLKDIISEEHPLVKLSDVVDWEALEEKFGVVFKKATGRPRLPARMIAGLHYLKYRYSLSDNAVVERWIENPYWQYFCGGTFFEHVFPLDPSSMSKWRRRLKGTGLEELLDRQSILGIVDDPSGRDKAKR